VVFLQTIHLVVLHLSLETDRFCYQQGCGMQTITVLSLAVRGVKGKAWLLPGFILFADLASAF
jgi:hypothetical protein